MANTTPEPNGLPAASGDAANSDRHKKGQFMARIRRKLAEQLKSFADARVTSPTEVANRAVMELLEREGYWPPKGWKPGQSEESE